MSLIITAANAERISQDVLCSNEDQILAVSIMDIFGNILASKSKDHFKNKFRRLHEDEDNLEYGAILSAVILALSNERKGISRETQAIITVYKDCKIMLLPLSCYQIIMEVVFPLSVNVEDFTVAGKIERLLLR